MRKRLPIVVLVLALVGGGLLQKVSAQQVTISGTVYDISAKRPLEAVGVISTSGRGVITDSLGKYTITVHPKDSIWFTLIGKTTMKYPVDTISNLENFNVMIHVRANELPEVKVRNSYYKLDSIQNRQDYAKVFNFKKPGIGLSRSSTGYNPGGLTVGFDLDEIINMFRVKRNRSILNLQKRLLDEEQEKYVNRRFSKAFVRKLTKLQGPELDTFMTRFRPDYAIVTLLSDLELGYYIQQNFIEYQAQRYNWKGALRKRE
ncbi:carboxypeptidase-like regulatory domain-containing protein [Sediminibacterium roseum]|uniref:Carboxypeptidase-like regulatory domain-containing protein n=1 Tax=Sediminibacterium roseum TaxID=1978412 RepID=A0ABW9ZXT2_9BACT|nr:carboxypeptidase-like regulatory domain-containing protein [Sediminibacterium roseum]NCI51971.1 carboxypeptidase-like regulatory domain-containing protein [Sediminibacterium roseum]